MKSLVFITVLTLFSIVSSAKKIEGKIIFKDDRVENVVLNIPLEMLTQNPNYKKLQQKIVYYDSLGGKKKKLIADDAKEITFNYRDDTIRMLSVRNYLNLGSSMAMNLYIFLKLEIDGPLKLFMYQTKNSMPSSTGIGTMDSPMVFIRIPFESWVVQKEGEGIKQFRSKKQMKSYFSDCPEIIEKIENKEFKTSDLKKIVTFYNANCSK